MAHVLVIDDESPVRTVLRYALEAAGHEVSEAADGREGMEAFARRRADLVVCDVFMPGQDGLETLRRLRRLDPAVKVIVMSGGSRSMPGVDFLRVARMLGAAAALAKPFGMAGLVALVAEVLGGPGRAAG